MPSRRWSHRNPGSLSVGAMQNRVRRSRPAVVSSPDGGDAVAEAATTANRDGRRQGESGLACSSECRGSGVDWVEAALQQQESRPTMRNTSSLYDAVLDLIGNDGRRWRPRPMWFWHRRCGRPASCTRASCLNGRD